MQILKRKACEVCARVAFPEEIPEDRGIIEEQPIQVQDIRKFLESLMDVANYEVHDFNSPDFTPTDVGMLTNNFLQLFDEEEEYLHITKCAEHIHNDYMLLLV